MLISNRDDVSILDIQLKGLRWKEPFKSASFLFSTTPEGHLHPTITFSPAPPDVTLRRWTLENGDITLADLSDVSLEEDAAMSIDFILQQCISGHSSSIGETIAEHLLKKAPRLVLTAAHGDLSVDAALYFPELDSADGPTCWDHILASEIIGSVLEFEFEDA